MITDRQRESIVRVLREHVPGLRTVYLFGSRAGDARHVGPDSDYDLAYDAEGHEPIRGQRRLALVNAVMDALGADALDLVDLRRDLGHVFRMNIIDGVQLFTRDAWASDERELHWSKLAMDFEVGDRPYREAQLAELRARVRT